MFVIRNFRRLPPLLQVASIVGRLLPLTAIALLVSALIAAWRSYSQLPADFPRVLLIGINLGLLGLAMTVVLSRYSLRFYQPNRTPYLLTSWQSQLRAMALLAATPLCGVVLALLIPLVVPGVILVILVTGMTMLAAIVLLMAIERTAGMVTDRDRIRASQRR